MNKTQKRVISLGLIVIVAMVIVPPWEKVLVDVGEGESRISVKPSRGYAPIFSPPTPTVAEKVGLGKVQIDKSRLLMQCAVVVVVAGVLAATTIALPTSDARAHIEQQARHANTTSALMLHLLSSSVLRRLRIGQVPAPQ